MQNTVQNIFEKKPDGLKLGRFEKRDENGERTKDDDDEDHDGEDWKQGVEKTDALLLARGARTALCLPAGTLLRSTASKIYCKRSTCIRRLRESLTASRAEQGCERKQKQMFLELPVLVDEPRRTFLECVCQYAK